jgi:hypothetical protein
MFKIVLLVFVGLVFTNCASKVATPSDAAKGYWEAVKNKKYDEAKKFTVSNDLKKSKIDRSIDVDDFTFGDINLTKNSAVIDTTMSISGILLSKKSDNEINFDTELKMIDNEWRVDAVSTKNNMYLSSAKLFMGGISGDIGNKLEEGIKSLEKLKPLFDDMVKKLQESIKK